jgi:hypothetical protein
MRCGVVFGDGTSVVKGGPSKRDEEESKAREEGVESRGDG